MGDVPTIKKKMTDNLLDCIMNASNNIEVKEEALKELIYILERAELGVEAFSREDTDWCYYPQLEDINASLKNAKLILSHF